MILRRVRIQNFRSIRDCKVEFGSHTAILGGNGAGKSTVLRAIERFYALSSAVALDDFFGGLPDQPIEIELTFGDLGDAEAELFASRMHNGEMTVVRVFDARGGKQSGKYYGKSVQHLAFSGIRSVLSANEKRAAYNGLRQGADYQSLPPAARADQIEDFLAAWEAEHPGRCELGLDDGQFFGFVNVGRASLQRFTSFVFIPAVREAGVDAQDSKGAVIAKLMELVVRSAIEKRAEIRAFQAEISQRYKEITDPSKLTELDDLSGMLTQTLQRLYMDAAVNLRWRETGDFPVPLPFADVFIDDDGFEGPVDRKGHGLQRALILTLLQHLAHASASAAEDEKDVAVAEPGQPDVQEPAERVGADLPPYVLPGLILAIEEPELYQHPTKQRHFAKVLQELSAGSLPGVAARTQVMFASHSSLFVSVERFEEIRLARRRSVEGVPHKECVLTSSSLDRLCRRLEGAFGEPVGTRNVDGLKSRLHVIGPELAEGFFADVAVVVEGANDRAALVAAANIAAVDFEGYGIAILPVGGKTKLVNLACIFQELDVPVFLTWDSDKESRQPRIDYNIALQRISGVVESQLEDYPATVNATFASFEVDLETTLKFEIGAEFYGALVDDAAQKFAREGRGDVIKSPAAMTDVLRSAAARGRMSPTLDAIVKAIVALRAASAGAGLAQIEEAAAAA